MKKFILILILVLIFGVWFWKYQKEETPTGNNSSGDSQLVFDRSISDGTVTFQFPEATYGFAINQTQVLTSSYISPCDEDFDYCLYRIGNEYQSTNFESAGFRIEKRVDLSNERLCLDTPPRGFDTTTKPTKSISKDTYSASTFASVGSAGAGHYASGSLYRLYYRQNSACYEFETRVGQSQFANYPVGSIQEFTKANEAKVFSELAQILDRVSLPSGQSKLFNF